VARTPRGGKSRKLRHLVYGPRPSAAQRARFLSQPTLICRGTLLPLDDGSIASIGRQIGRAPEAGDQHRVDRVEALLTEK
jgi:hypothetical protein